MMGSRYIKISILSAFSIITILGFQNCAPAKFSDASGVAGVSFSAGGDDSLESENGSMPEEVEQRDPSDDGLAAVMPKEGDDQSVPKKKDCDVAKESKGKEMPQQPEESSDESEENLVECDMGRPNTKVILNAMLKASHSNASATRVCMSENACLKVINAFAAKRDCSLSKPVSGDSGEQCTQIFPGSKGTCKNAAKISDAEVAEILKKME
ncbi:hypothetical protein [Bdellovibrio sp. HCB337]|uniref:hypothetical protein n=1 Tax=Bdellovibrio sp. HCB337 TaxID=3394358 RepID=UPI0039A6EAE5